MNDCSCAIKSSKPMGEMSTEELSDEIAFLLSEEGQKLCAAKDKKIVQFFIPWKKVHVFDKVKAKSHFPNVGYWRPDKDSKDIIDDNFMVDVEFNDDEGRCMSKRLMQTGAKLIESTGESTGYVRILDIEDSTL